MYNFHFIIFGLRAFTSYLGLTTYISGQNKKADLKFSSSDCDLIFRLKLEPM